MREFAEERAACLLYAMGIDGIPNLEQVLRLPDQFGDGLTIEPTQPGRRSSFREREDGGGIIHLEPEPDDEKLAWTVAEEVGHFVTLAGAGTRYCHYAAAEMTRRETRELARRWMLVEENAANRFAMSLRLPWPAIDRYRDNDELAWLAGCSVATVLERRRQVAQHRPHLPTAPVWSALFRYAFRHTPGASPILELVPNSWQPPGRFPVFRQGVGPDDLEEAEMRFAAEMFALTPTEFALKHWRIRIPPSSEREHTREDIDRWRRRRR